MDSIAWALSRPMWTNCDEAGLVRAARVEPDAFAELCMRYSGHLYSYFRARSRSDEDAADLTQQVFVKALASLPRYRERGLPFGAWLFQIARNLVVDVHRRRKDTVSWDLLPETAGAVEADAVDSALLRQEDRARMHALLDDLPPDPRELIVLRFVAGLTLREIAAVVGKSEPTIHKQIKRTLRTLQERYNDGE